MRLDDGGTTGMTVPAGGTPVVSTASAKTKARKVADADTQAAILAALNLIDAVQVTGPDPRRLKVNGGRAKSKKWNSL